MLTTPSSLMKPHLLIREGINWADIEWVDNAECLDLIERVSFDHNMGRDLECMGTNKSLIIITCCTLYRN